MLTIDDNMSNYRNTPRLTPSRKETSMTKPSVVSIPTHRRQTTANQTLRPLKSKKRSTLATP